jgi:uroporphyrinogen-III synthase
LTGLPLTGRTVVVTRTRAQASGLVDRLTGLGAEVVELPVIAVEGPTDGGEAPARAAHRLASGAYQWVAFTSSNAVVRFLAELGDRAVPDSVRWAALGAGTARALEEAGRPVDLVPRTSVAEALAEAFPNAGSGGSGAGAGGPGDPGTVLFPRAETVRGALAAGLRARGWLVDEVVVYRTVAGDPSPEAVSAAGRADAVAFTSSSTVARTL